MITELTPTKTDLDCQFTAFQRVRALVQNDWPEPELHLFGSSVNGLCTANSSDMDLSLQLPEAVGHVSGWQSRHYFAIVKKYICNKNPVLI